MYMPNEIAPDFIQSTDTPAASGESLGAWLARTRSDRGMAPRDAARRLRLNLAIVQAIEADNFAWLGPPVFVRGYLSRYAQLLDLPESEVLERHRQQSGPSQEPPLKVVLPVQRQSRLWDLRGLLYLLLVIGIGWTAVQHLGDLDPGRLLGWWKQDHDQNVVSQPASSAGPTPSSTTQTHYPFQPKPAEVASAPTAPATPTPAVPPSSEAPAPKPEAPAAPLASITALPIPAPVLPTPPVEHLPIVAVPDLSATITAPVTSITGASLDANGEAKLLLEFSNDCWVEIKDAQGNVLTSGLMKANSTHSIAGVAPFKVTLGNAPAARIVLDDRLVDAAVYVPRRGTVSRFTLERGQP